MASNNIIDEIGKNIDSFSFVNAIGSFINNAKFKSGFDQLCSVNSKDTYIWSTLSCIGEQYGNVIYENVLNYIDNVANIDLCKVTALQSMMKIVGVEYDVLNAFSHIPVEIARLMDLLSINHKYLLDSKTFKQSFIDYLKEHGVILSGDPNTFGLSNVLSSTEYEPDISSHIYDNGLYVDEKQYEKFLKDVYNEVLTSFVYMKYADAEVGLSTEHEYIYQYIKNELMAGQQVADVFQQTPYQAAISKLKIQYNINKSFNQEAIVDAIENGYDSYENYNIYQQQILDYEIRHRQDTYAYAKTYLSSQTGEGYNITRFSYYREKKVKEYFKFIEDTFNNLIAEDSIKNAIQNNVDVSISAYEPDINYFNVDQLAKYPFLSYDELLDSIYIQTNQINRIVELLVQQTLAIANIRDQIKTQIRKSYMRGTFLLISYVINEFLKYNIIEKYGKAFKTEDTNVELGTILSTSIMRGDNVELIEYYDSTEYFNISCNDSADVKYGKTANEKFWDNLEDKIGKTTRDLPLDEIEQFYLKQMKLEKNKVDNIVNFLSIIYEYGANNSYINRVTDEYTCYVPGKSVNNPPIKIGDPYNYILSAEHDILSVQVILEGIDIYIKNGSYVEDLSSIKPISSQLDDLCSVVSSFYWNEISTANEQVKEQTFDQICTDYDTANGIADELTDISSQYEDLKDNSKYSYYLKTTDDYIRYNELVPAYFVEKMYNFRLSVENGIVWRNKGLDISLSNMLCNYYELSGDLFTKLFALSVWPVDTVKKPNSIYYNKSTTYWPYYSPNYDDELTTTTLNLKTYLVDQVQVQNDNAMQHIQTHYDKLLGYKADVADIMTQCNGAIAQYEAMRTAIEAVSMTKMEDDYTESCFVNIEPVTAPIVQWHIDAKETSKGKYEIDEGQDPDGYYEIIGSSDYVVTELIEYESPGINDYDGIRTKLDKLAQRSYIEKYSKLLYGKILSKSDECPDENCEFFSEREGHDYYWEFKEKDEETGEIEVIDSGWGHYYTYTLTGSNGYYYDRASKSQPWAGAYSQDAASQIIETLNNAVENLNNFITLINSEVNCLGGSFTKINVGSIDIDNVYEKSANAYKQLTNRIDNLDNYIYAGTEANGWQSLTSDNNLLPFINRLKTISAINLSDDVKYNIRNIDSRFNALQLSVQNTLANYSDYFDQYVNNEADRLDKQILAMSAYMINRDAQASAEVLSSIEDISSQYVDQLNDFMSFALLLNRMTVDSINDDYSYNLYPTMYLTEIYSQVSGNGSPYGSNWPWRMRDCLDYLLCGNYICGDWDQQLSGVLYWLPNAFQEFENSARNKINEKIPQLQEYIEITGLLEIAKTKYAAKVKDEDLLLTQKLNAVIEDFQSDIVYISSQIPFYDKSYEIYLKYNGTDIGYDPFYNYKNTAYSSYQIHPYLYNFVEKSNLLYPLANNFFIAFHESYEKELISKGIDNILGQYGNVKNTWKSGLFDWTGYQSKYEKHVYKSDSTLATTNPNVGFNGLFYPPAVKALLDDPDTFLQNVQDNSPDSYYFHLNLTQSQCQKIYEQLLAYEPIIRYVATAQKTNQLSGEYDIYKYAEDCMGNSIFLLKSYKHLYEQHNGDPNYQPSYHEKRNTLGELWMRVKDHPLAFPAIDLREGYNDISQYSIKKSNNSFAENINSYISVLNEYFKSHENDNDYLSTAFLTRDTIGQYQTTGFSDSVSQYDLTPPEKSQHLNCFFDFETDVLNQSLLLVVPFQTGEHWESVYYNENGAFKNKLEYDNIRYADSSIVVSYLGDHVLFNSMTDQTNVYLFTTDVYTETNTNVDSIPNRQMLVNGELQTTKNTTYFMEFIGFAKNSLFVYAIFARKYFVYNTKDGSFTFIRRLGQQPILEIDYIGYKCHYPLLDQQTAQSEPLLYDVYDWHSDNNDIHKDELPYINASNIALASGNKQLTVAFLTKRTQTKASQYGDNVKIVNFAQYTSQMESYNPLSASGENLSYPRSTALIQTTDYQHINIYNSFDSFVQHLVMVTFDFVDTILDNPTTRYYNLNSDIGYLPQYADKPGISYYSENTALCNASRYNIELLGPEKSDITFTPIITTTGEEKYGRVVEEYKEINKISAFNDVDLSVQVNAYVVQYQFNLSDVFIDNFMKTSGMPKDEAESEWKSMLDTSELLSYKYVLYNTNYLAMPILKGNLSDVLPNGYYYQGSELYDLLSGEDIIGPNQTTYQNIDMSNHINNISVISANVEFDANESMLPYKVNISCIVRLSADNEQIIPSNTFYMLLYVKNNTLSYKYHHLFENANANIISDQTYVMSGDQEWGIDLAKAGAGLSSISVSTYDGESIYPFNSLPPNGKPSQLSAPLEFKYSEEDKDYINREFPNIDPIDAEDEITIVENDSQSIYYFSLDGYDAINLDAFKMKVFDPNTSSVNIFKVNPFLPKYRDFYSRALVIEATYNMEQTIDSTMTDKKYEIVEYFNYKNFTNPQYVTINWPDNANLPPDAYVCDATDKSIEDTYLVLRPGQSGKLDLRVDFVQYQKLKETNINQSIVGAHSSIIKTYYIMNVSDDKPKFIVSRTPFVGNDHGVIEHGNYELENVYYPGMTFRYVMMVILQTRTSDTTTSPLANYVAMSQIAFYAPQRNGELKRFDYPDDTTVNIADGYTPEDHLIVYPNVPANLLNEDPDKEFFASDLHLNDGYPLSIMIDMKTQALDVEEYSIWAWYNSHCSNSHVGYMPKSFYLAFSNDQVRWYMGDSFSDTKNSLPTTNYAKAYQSQLHMNDDD